MTVAINIIVNALAILVNSIITVSLIGLIHFNLYRISLDFLTPYLSWFGLTSIPNEYVPLIVTGAIMAGLVAISLTPAADYLLRPIYGFRLPLSDEENKLYTLFRAVCRDAGKDANNYKLFIVDEQFPNAYALGLNNVAVTRRLLKDFSDNEIKAVMAHELGHLHYGDSLYSKIFMTVSIVGQVVLIVYYAIGNFFSTLARVPIPFLNLIILFIGWGFSIQAWLFNLLLLIPLGFGKMLGSRECEYRADRYACQIGHHAGLRQFLYKLLDMDTRSHKGLWAILRASHPATGKRIHRLEVAENEKGMPARLELNQ